MVKRHNHLKIGQYHQHLMELLDPEATPLQCAQSTTAKHTSPDASRASMLCLPDVCRSIFCLCAGT